MEAGWEASIAHIERFDVLLRRVVADGIARGKALIAALGNLKRETLNHNFAQMESVWDAYRVYAGKT